MGSCLWLGAQVGGTLLLGDLLALGLGSGLGGLGSCRLLGGPAEKRGVRREVSVSVLCREGWGCSAGTTHLVALAAAPAAGASPSCSASYCSMASTAEGKGVGARAGVSGAGCLRTTVGRAPRTKLLGHQQNGVVGVAAHGLHQLQCQLKVLGQQLLVLDVPILGLLGGRCLGGLGGRCLGGRCLGGRGSLHSLGSLGCSCAGAGEGGKGMGEGGGTGRSHTRWAGGCGKESEARWRQCEPQNSQEQDQGAGNAAAMIRHSLLVAGICKGRVKREWRANHRDQISFCSMPLYTLD